MSGSKDKWMTRVTGCAAALSVGAVLSIVLFLVWSSLPWLRAGDVYSVFSTGWSPYGEPATYGIGPMLLGSAVLSVLALAVAFPLGVGICSFAHGLAPPWLARFVLGVVHFMTGIPTVIYAFVSVFLLVPLLRDTFQRGTGYSLLAAGLALAVLILPTIVLLLHVQMQQIDPDVKLACEALGMRPVQTQLRVLFPLARRGLLAAAVLGLSRALGDTMVALMVAGNAAQEPSSLHDSIRTLTSHIALVLATDVYSPEYRSLSAAGLFLFLFTAVMSFLLRRLCGGAHGPEGGPKR